MSLAPNFKRYTGKTQIRFTVFGTIFRVECIATYTDSNDFTEGPEFTYWRKMNNEDLLNFKITLIKTKTK